MNIFLFLLLFAIAAVATLFVIVAGTSGHVGSITIDAKTGMVISAFAVILWGFLAISAFEITVYSGGQEMTASYPGVAWLAVAAGAVALFVTYQATVQLIEDTGGI